MLSNLRTLDSILYYDSENVLDAIGQQGTIAEAFDFASMTFIPLKSGFDKIDLKKRDKEENMIRFPTYRQYDMLGMVCCPPSYPEDIDYVKEEVERTAARIDGKKVCNVLREQRIRLAVANDILFKSEECPSIGACAGTCEKCDMESTYLRKQLQKIPENQRVYLKFDPAEEVL